jgi:hypothetical protein
MSAVGRAVSELGILIQKVHEVFASSARAGAG